MNLSTGSVHENTIRRNFFGRVGAESGFLLPGVLLGSVGSLLVAWRYYLATDPQLIGFHFLAVSAGYLAAAVLSSFVLPRLSTRVLAAGASLIGFSAYVALYFVSPPAPCCGAYWGWVLPDLREAG